MTLYADALALFGAAYSGLALLQIEPGPSTTASRVNSSISATWPTA